MSNPWYARYPGDYAQDTAHLTIMEHGAYSLLLDHYYTVEGPIGRPQPKDGGGQFMQMQLLCTSFAENLHRICRAFSTEERNAINNVLAHFFIETPEGFRNLRADKEIATRKAISESKKIGANARHGKDRANARQKALKAAKSIETHTAKEWQTLLSIYGHQCCKCGASMEDTVLEKDHILPVVKGGSDGMANLQPLCHPCNASKGDSVEDYRQIALSRIASKNSASELHLHTQPQPQSHILQQQQRAGEVGQVGDKKATGQEMRFIECFDDHEADLKRVFPHADYEAEKLKCVAHYAKAPSVGPDPWPTVSKWFGRIPKPTTRQTLPDVRTENYEAAREFCNDAR